MNEQILISDINNKIPDLDTSNVILLPLMLPSYAIKKIVSDLHKIGGGTIVIGYSSKDNSLVSQADFYCERIMEKADIADKVKYQRVIINGKELFIIQIEEDEKFTKWRNDLCEDTKETMR